MTVRRLIDLFSCFSKVPVEIEEIRDQIIEWGYYNSIVISPFDESPGDLLGNLTVYTNTHVYGAESVHCVVRYNRNASLPWQRLTCAKELIHSLDPEKLKVNSKDKFERLLKEMPVNGNNPSGMDAPAIFEEIATYQALLVLCPEEARERLYQGHKDGKYTLSDVAAILEIPERYAYSILQDDWPEYQAKLVAISD